ncbi:MAG: alpha/beta hydrolase [Lachnospiraceae bacterium]|nr:alpha/beta hydrolase [Lachnospiraceae bacterium]
MSFKDIAIHALQYYFILTFILTVISILRMYRIRHRAAAAKYGKARMNKLVEEHRLRQFPVYTMDEIKSRRSRGAVRVTFFPADTVEPAKVAIICPGGGYDHLEEKYEGYPVAAKLNEMGINAFVLEYRVGRHCSYHAPIHDLARTVQYITEHQDDFHVDMKDYAVIGFSAGGNMAGLFGSEKYGYKNYGVAKPGALLMGYPWTNVNHWAQHPYWNIWVGLMGVWLSERGNFWMFRLHHFNHEYRESLCVQRWITEDFPPVYMFAGGNDILVPSGAHTDVLEKALKQYHVPYKYEKFFGVPHGVGLGLHTSAEGWLDTAVEFWKEQI